MRGTLQTSRRNFLAATVVAAVAVPSMTKTASAEASHALRSLIGAHRKAYCAFVERPSKAGDRAEQETLLAVCAFPARSQGDRKLKARYLLEVEARGELDLPQHIQAVLGSMA